MSSIRARAAAESEADTAKKQLGFVVGAAGQPELAEKAQPDSTGHPQPRMPDGFWFRAPTNSVTRETTPPCEGGTTGNAPRCGLRS
jgi:hypothetical protein